MKPNRKYFEEENKKQFKRLTIKKSDKKIEMKHVQSSLTELVIIKQLYES